MAKKVLPENYKDDILTDEMNGRRKYNLIQNQDGTYSLVDVTDYAQIGNNIGASQINDITKAVNQSFDASKIINSLSKASSIVEEGFVPDVLALNELNQKIVIKNYLSLPEVEIVAGGSGNIVIDIPDASEYISNGYTGYILSAFLSTSFVVSNTLSLNVTSDGKIAISYKSNGTVTSSQPRASIMWYKK